MESSDRNRVLSQVLGFNNSQYPRAKNALLLSATPYDRDIEQLRNQLILVGKSNLLPEDLTIDDKQAVKDHVSKFMIRRLNCLKVNGKDHTRNMYRREYRSKAQVNLQSDEQKLVTALVQKKIGEMMNRDGSNPAFQIGMMASFESYAQTAKAEPVQFDSDEPHKSQADAQDLHVVSHIVDSYKNAGLGKTLPHPKMDTICQQLAEKLFYQGKKQIVFVRRVKSVKELKDKLDDHYNDWLQGYIDSQVADYPNLQLFFLKLFEVYHRESLEKDRDISEGNSQQGQEGDVEDSQPPKNDTFFAWFFRGEITPIATNIYNDKTYKIPSIPEALRKGLTANNQSTSILLELNWAYYIAKQEGFDLQNKIKSNAGLILKEANKFFSGKPTDKDKLGAYNACQIGFIEWYCNDTKHQASYLGPLRDSLCFQCSKQANSNTISLSELEDNLLATTFYTELYNKDLTKTLLSLQDRVYKCLREDSWGDGEDYNKLAIQCYLFSLVLRTGHGIIDMYLARLRQGDANPTKETRNSWMVDLVECLTKQQSSSQFSTFNELQAITNQLDLIIKVNVPEIYDKKTNEYRRFLSQRLNPVSPIIGATGETSGIRSAQARKFRMPGYPLALISTNVFQEGEDLHTFCDSVVHYGLSGSPVSIEQKTGRVDRVNSIFQRRIETNTKTNPNDFIQVCFPFIKESIELLQVRQLCHNINDFITSLHDVTGTPTDKYKEHVETNHAIIDKSNIPSQINAFLKSPYIPTEDIYMGKSFTGYVNKRELHSIENVKYIKSLVENVAGVNSSKDRFIYRNHENIEVQIRLDSAKSCGELLLIADSESSECCLSQYDLNYKMKDSWNNIQRTLAVKTAKGCYSLKSNIEMLVGGAAVTQQEDIEFFFTRLNDQQDCFSLDEPKKIYSPNIKDFCKKISDKPLSLNNVPLDTSVTVQNHEHYIELKFCLGDGRLRRRKHNIRLYETNGVCVFIAKALTSSHINKIDSKYRDEKIIEYTWVRNNYVDVVDFLYDPDKGITGRVAHPVNSLNWEEFLFCAYILAVEADRLEYVVDQEDTL
jgi:hypothetical protein